MLALYKEEARIIIEHLLNMVMLSHLFSVNIGAILIFCIYNLFFIIISNNKPLIFHREKLYLSMDIIKLYSEILIEGVIRQLI